MSMETYYKNYLKHHGIRGQRWGKKNRPPYPLSPGDHSVSEKKAGWKKSLDSKESNNDNKGEFHLTDKQKKALIVAGVATAAVVGGVVLYKSGAVNPILNSYINVGEEAVGHISKMNISDYSPKVQKAYNETRKIITGMNPDNSHTNCMTCSFTQELNRRGYPNLCAKDGPFSPKDIGKIFDGAKMQPVDFARDPSLTTKEAYDMMIEQFQDFGEGSRGIVTGYWSGSNEGHALAWQVVDSKVIFSDGQTGQIFIDNAFKDLFKDMIPQSLGTVRLDNRDIINGTFELFTKVR